MCRSDINDIVLSESYANRSPGKKVNIIVTDAFGLPTTAPYIDLSGSVKQIWEGQHAFPSAANLVIRDIPSHRFLENDNRIRGFPSYSMSALKKLPSKREE